MLKRPMKLSPIRKFVILNPSIFHRFVFLSIQKCGIQGTQYVHYNNSKWDLPRKGGYMVIMDSNTLHRKVFLKQ